ncbi:MAG TPA: S1/P1 nuclease [Rhodanobacteraceae bacterium]|nr:S1/P1 nuclease [Rhodanobacteraceae bacterium]
MAKRVHRWIGWGVLATAMLASAPAAWAWGAKGHRIVARLAEAQLTPVALATARRLLAVSGAKHLADVATWADGLRESDPTLFERTRRMHYVDFDSPACVYRPPQECRNGECAVAAIDHYSAILADRHAGDAVRAEALAFVVHFVGDVHQPLHADYRRDLGGNRFQVYWRGHGSNLHRLWDSGLLESTGWSAARYARQLAHVPASLPTGGTPATWAEESCRIDRDGGVYPQSHVIDEAYVAHALPIAEQRLQQAGVRLARLLNADLGSG